MPTQRQHDQLYKRDPAAPHPGKSWGSNRRPRDVWGYPSHPPWRVRRDPCGRSRKCRTWRVVDESGGVSYWIKIYETSQFDYDKKKGLLVAPTCLRSKVSGLCNYLHVLYLFILDVPFTLLVRTFRPCEVLKLHVVLPINSFSLFPFFFNPFGSSLHEINKPIRNHYLSIVIGHHTTIYKPFVDRSFYFFGTNRRQRLKIPHWLV